MTGDGGANPVVETQAVESAAVETPTVAGDGGANPIAVAERM